MIGAAFMPQVAAKGRGANGSAERPLEPPDDPDIAPEGAQAPAAADRRPGGDDIATSLPLPGISFMPSMSMGKWFSSRPASSSGPTSEKGADEGTDASASGLNSHDLRPAAAKAVAEPQRGDDMQTLDAQKGEGKEVDDRKATSFQSFMERLQQAKDLKRHVLVRIAQINNPSEVPSPAHAHNTDAAHGDGSPAGQGGGGAGVLHGGDARSRIQEQAVDLIEDLQQRVRRHALWSSASQDELDTADEAIEKLVTLKLYHRLFGASEHERTVDALLHRRIQCLQFLQPQHFDIGDQVLSSSSSQSCLEVARRELCKMNNYKSPKDKVVCIYNCCKLAARVLALTSEASTGADELLPLLILLLLQANPSALHSNLAFITNCRHPSRLNGEQGYFLTTISSASEFLRNVCDDDGLLARAGALSIDSSEFRRRFCERKRCLADTPAGAPGQPLPASQLDDSLPEHEGAAEGVHVHQGASPRSGGMADESLCANAMAPGPQVHQGSDGAAANATGAAGAGESMAAAAADGVESSRGASSSGNAAASTSSSRSGKPGAVLEGGEPAGKGPSADVERMRSLAVAGNLHLHPAFAYDGAASVADVADLLAQYQALAGAVRLLLESDTN